jgi:hypothetical protein
MLSQIQTKLNSYKHQDADKKGRDNGLIGTKEVVEKLLACDLTCFYCKVDVFVLYEIVREMNQWTLDRINNDDGHNADNVVISCLECNLKRRRQSSDKFIFTKQMKITRINT